MEINHEECFRVIRENVFVNLRQLKDKIRLDSDERLDRIRLWYKNKNFKIHTFPKPSLTFTYILHRYLEQIA